MMEPLRRARHGLSPLRALPNWIPTQFTEEDTEAKEGAVTCPVSQYACGWLRSCLQNLVLAHCYSTPISYPMSCYMVLPLPECPSAPTLLSCRTPWAPLGWGLHLFVCWRRSTRRCDTGVTLELDQAAHSLPLCFGMCVPLAFSAPRSCFGTEDTASRWRCVDTISKGTTWLIPVQAPWVCDQTQLSPLYRTFKIIAGMCRKLLVFRLLEISLLSSLVY